MLNTLNFFKNLHHRVKKWLKYTFENRNFNNFLHLQVKILKNTCLIHKISSLFCISSLENV